MKRNKKINKLLNELILNTLCYYLILFFKFFFYFFVNGNKQTKNSCFGVKNESFGIILISYMLLFINCVVASEFKLLIKKPTRMNIEIFNFSFGIY